MRYEDHTERTYDENADHGWRELDNDRAREEHERREDPLGAVDRASEAYGEHNDCVVRAFSLAFDVPYAKAHEVLADRGRRARGRVYSDTYKWARKDLEEYTGRTTEALYPRKRSYRKGLGYYPGKYTPKTIGEKYPTGRYICHVRGHAFALVDGKVLDWVANRNHRINWVERVDTTS